jgi:NitT/TauT family transport system permease protein
MAIAAVGRVSNDRARWAVYAASLLAGAALWEILGTRMDPVFLEPLSTTLVRGAAIVISGQLPAALLESMLLFGTGLGAAIVFGVPFGLLNARIRFLRVGAEDYITALYATPMVALVPFIMAIFGLWFTPKAIIVFLFAVFPIIINVFEGARSVDPKLLEVARSFRANERQIWRDVVLPYTLPFAMTGIRLAIARGLVGVIVAEFFLAASGLGELILIFSRRFDTAAVFAVIMVVCLVGVGLMALGQYLENRFARWRGA